MVDQPPRRAHWPVCRCPAAGINPALRYPPVWPPLPMDESAGLRIVTARFGKPKNQKGIIMSKAKYFALALAAVVVAVGCASTDQQSGPIEASVDFTSADSVVNSQSLVRITPRYPMQAAQTGVSGDCTLLFDLEPYKPSEQTGARPSNIQVLECASPLFAEESKQALNRWLFRSLEQIDGPTNGRTITFRFLLAAAKQ